MMEWMPIPKGNIGIYKPPSVHVSNGGAYATVCFNAASRALLGSHYVILKADGRWAIRSARENDNPDFVRVVSPQGTITLRNAPPCGCYGLQQRDDVWVLALEEVA